MGYERFAASASYRNLIKIYDLRMPGQKVYSYRNVASTSPSTPDVDPNDPHLLEYQEHTVWGTYLTETRREYSHFSRLVTGSSFGRSLYTGLPGKIVELDFSEGRKTAPEPLVEGLSGYTYNNNNGVVRQYERRGRTYGKRVYGLDDGWVSTFWWDCNSPLHFWTDVGGWG